MGGFLHFVETGLQALSPDQLKKLGLGHAFTKSPEYRKAELALDGDPAVSGLLLSQSSDFEGVPQGVNVPKQRWRLRGEFDGCRVWTGFNVEDPPTPDVLFLGRALSHTPWTDAQGREWRMPRVGDVDEFGEHQAALPREVDFDANGEPTHGEVVTRYRDLWESSEPLWQSLVNDKTVETRAASAFALQCLSALYRVSHIELGLLGVFSEEAEHSPEVFTAAALGYYRYSAWEEAKDRDPLPSSELTSSSDTEGGKAA